MTDVELLPRANLRTVLRGDAQIVGSRCDPKLPRGLVSPIEARITAGMPYGDLAAAEAEYLRGRTTCSDVAVLARAALASALSGSGNAREERRPYVVSAYLDNVTITGAVEEIFAPLRGENGERAKVVCFAHPHALNLARFNTELANQLARADVVLPDGIGIRIAARLLGVAMRHNVNGTDLLPVLCGEAVSREIPLVLVGAAEGVAERCSAQLRDTFPGLSIPIVSDGYVDERASVELAQRIAALGRCVVLVGMGTPIQERWTFQYLGDIPGVTALTVGGLFDFFSGDRRRAPVAWRELGIEWLYRMLQEPRRLAKRYLVGNPFFLGLAALQRLSGDDR